MLMSLAQGRALEQHASRAYRLYAVRDPAHPRVVRGPIQPGLVPLVPVRDRLSASHRCDRWMFAAGEFFFSWRLTGPYGLDGLLPILYPPERDGVVLAPFVVLPAFLWWVLCRSPSPTTHWSSTGIHEPVAWPLIAACLWWPMTSIKVEAEDIRSRSRCSLPWARLSLAICLVFRKPTLAPSALVGAKVAAGGLPPLRCVFAVLLAPS